MKKFFQIIWTQIADGIEKSTVGTLVMFGCFGCIVYLVAKEGGSDTVESLITTAMIVAATLMGVTSVADIFKINKTTNTTKGNCNTIPPEYPAPSNNKESMDP